jgi:hypothetical protein
VKSLERQAIQELGDRIEWPDLPAVRDRAEVRVLERRREQRRGGGMHADRRTARGLRDNGVEVDEPRSEERRGDLLQGAVHPAVQVDLVVEGAEERADGALFGERWQRNQHLLRRADVVVLLHCADRVGIYLPPGSTVDVVCEKTRIESRTGAHDHEVCAIRSWQPFRDDRSYARCASPDDENIPRLEC